jgi:hypothetical protein
MTGYDCYSIFSGIKLHFSTDSYDFFKYSGKSNVSQTSFENRKDKYFFYKLSRKYPTKEILIDFLVANFLENEKMWIGDLINDDADSIYLKRQKFVQSLSYSFEEDCKIIFEDVKDPNDVLVVEQDYPILLTKTFRKEIHFETLCILNMILDFLPMWKNKISDTIRFPEYARKIEKFTCFLPKDVVKYKLILRKVVL